MRHLLLLMILGITLIAGGCANTPAEDDTTNASTAEKQLTLWTIFNDSTPQNDIDRWLVEVLATTQDELGITVTNVHQNYAHINSRLSIAVDAGDGVPDISYVNSQQLSFHVQRGTLSDLTDYVRNAPWFDDLDPKALEGCTGADGKIYCVPAYTYSRLIYYWKDTWPNGFPADTETFLQQAEALKQQNTYAITFKGSEAAASEGFFYSIIRSFGGRYADENGRATWASPETTEAIAFLRTLAQNDYIPDVVFAPGFEHERVFADGAAASFGAGSWSLNYLTPLTAPSGESFEDGSRAVLQAMEANELGLAPYLAAPGNDPVVLLTMPGWAIPRGSPQPELAKQMIDHLMTTENNANYAVAAGGIPTLQSSANDPRLSGPYWQFIQQNQQQYGEFMPPLLDYDRALTLLSTSINDLVLHPERDILTELQDIQEEYNATQP